MRTWKGFKRDPLSQPVFSLFLNMDAWARHMIFAYNNGRVWCGQIRARQLRPTTAFVAEMTEAWRGEFQKGVKKFEDGNYESAILFFTAVSIQCVPLR